VGAVVGATHKEEGIKLRQMMKNTFFLIPGYGAQGAIAYDVAGMFDENGGGGIVNSSRGIICAWEKMPELSFVEAARKAVIDMRDDINKAIKF
jgi:orotidine-5'-phosphate decarboxylase